jgi:hypothetical protein
MVIVNLRCENSLYFLKQEPFLDYDRTTVLKPQLLHLHDSSLDSSTDNEIFYYVMAVSKETHYTRVSCLCLVFE